MQSFIAVDWSGALAGARRKLWLAEVRDSRLVRVECGRSRAELTAHLLECARRQPLTVVGLDFAFSFPAWFLRQRELASAFDLWSLAAREGEHWLAHCPWPFWGKFEKPMTIPHPELSPFRRTESDSLPVAGVAPKSVFQLGGAGAVGTGSLRGMPHLHDLRANGFAIWPFDAPRAPLALEIYPRYLTGRVVKSDVRARESHLARHCGDQEPALLEIAASCEDAFDAAVSALCMSQHAASFARLRGHEDPVYRLEGRIWRPAQDPHFPCA